MTLRRLLPLLLAVGVVMAGCGSAGGGGDTGSSTDATGVIVTDTVATDTTDTTDTTFTDTGATDTIVTDTVSGDSTPYTDAKARYTIEIPNSWTKSDISSAGSLDAHAWYINGDADAFRENVNIITEGPTNGISLDDYAELTINRAPEQIQNFNVESRDHITLDNGDDAVRIVYTGRTARVTSDYKFLAIMSVGDTLAYTATYTAAPDMFDKYAGEVESVIKTLDHA